MRRLLVPVAVLALATSLVACTTADSSPTAAPEDSTEVPTPCERPAPAISQHDVAYAEVPGVDPNLLSLDVDVPERPDCEPVPVVVWVHGGGWQAGDKANRNVDDKRRLFTDAGYAFVAVNYRLSPDPVDLDDDDRITYPTHPQDVADALAHLDQHAAELGIDPDRIALLGHSAGAGIVSLVATDESFLEDAGLDPTQLACTVSLDTQAYDVTTVASIAGSAGLLYENAFTDQPEVWAEASPVNQVDGDESPLLVVTRGAEPRVEGARAFVELLERNGVDARLLDANPYSHEDVSRQVGAANDDVVTPAIIDLYADCLA